MHHHASHARREFRLSDTMSPLTSQPHLDVIIDSGPILFLEHAWTPSNVASLLTLTSVQLSSE